MNNKFLQVEAISKSGKDLGTVRLNLSNVLYFRDWITHDVNEKNLLVAYMTGGKEVVLKMTSKDLESQLSIASEVLS
jgi:hypothetical protein